MPEPADDKRDVETRNPAIVPFRNTLHANFKELLLTLLIVGFGIVLLYFKGDSAFNAMLQLEMALIGGLVGRLTAK